MVDGPSGSARERILARRRRFVALTLGALAGQGCSGASGEPTQPHDARDTTAASATAKGSGTSTTQLPEGWHVMQAPPQPASSPHPSGPGSPEQLPAPEQGRDVMLPAPGSPDRKVVVRVCLSIVPVAPTLSFAPGGHQLRAEHHPLLDEVAKILREHPAKGVIVEGHAAGNEPGAGELSARRAHTVLRALVQRGVSPGQLCETAEGSRKPLVPERDATSRAKNRRVHFVVRDADEPCP